MPDEEGAIGDVRPHIVKELFDDKGDLTLKTEIPPRMVLTLLRMKLVTEAMNPKRTKSLIQVFEEEFKRIMVSYKRRGREEMLVGLRALTLSEEEEEPARI